MESHEPDHATTPLPGDTGGENEQDFLVSPRYLAGSDGDLHPVTDPLKAAGWLSFSDEHQTTRHFAPDRRTCVAYLALDRPDMDHGLDQSWQVWGRKGTHGPATWHISISSECPAEIVGGIATALVTPAPGSGTGGEDHGMRPLTQAEWRRDPQNSHPTYCAPDGQAFVRYIAPSPGPHEAALADINAWYAGAGTYRLFEMQWFAAFTAATPRHLVEAFCAALADPEPLPRYASDLDPDIRPFLRLTPG